MQYYPYFLLTGLSPPYNGEPERGGGERLLIRFYVFNLQLYLASFMGIFLNGIANVEGTFGLDEAYVRTLSESDAVHHIV